MGGLCCWLVVPPVLVGAEGVGEVDPELAGSSRRVVGGLVVEAVAVAVKIHHAHSCYYC